MLASSIDRLCRLLCLWLAEQCRKIFVLVGSKNFRCWPPSSQHLHLSDELTASCWLEITVVPRVQLVNNADQPAYEEMSFIYVP